ncbi:MAG: DUF1957 domain-containing protein [Candidatus Nitronauta litoralis]|uniref:DUF1957 domain-containing protein n=1 Tax=Candidatus Nitronauta litoralis TaxID=2705533 RepID=A0A7T0BWT4_9BACT|nr:MAG: DUF1957 domain-containing protein [Candidatus Nitronauta litoralis]
MPQGFLAFVLHAHLPFVRHPEHEEFLEEDWFYQAITETYIPLIHMFEGLMRDQVPFRLTMSLTPTLLSMMEDPLLQERYIRHLESSLELAEKEVNRTQGDDQFHPLALYYQKRFREAHTTFCDRYQRNLISAFRKVMEAGHLEIVTCGATHGFLPLMETQPNAIRAQIEVAARTHERLLGRRPRGIWLPECGYTPGIENFLKDAGISFFFLDSHGVLNATPRPKFGHYAPVVCPNNVAVFARDPETSKQVWSANEGYPGDVDYRDFYRDVGFDLDYDYVKPHIASTGDRKMTGFKYFRITGEGDHKEPYKPEWAMEKAAEHAGNFMFNREKQIEHLHGSMGREPLVLSMYDAELFGHWWDEGPKWLDFVIRKSAYDQNVFELTTPPEYLERFPNCQQTIPSASSWGYKGHNEYWLNDKTHWIYPHLLAAAEMMHKLAKSFPVAEGVTLRALNQAARELLLAQSSDWAFIIKADTMVEYAEKRTKTHLDRFLNLYHGIVNNDFEEDELQKIETLDNLFPDIDYRVYL